MGSPQISLFPDTVPGQSGTKSGSSVMPQLLWPCSLRDGLTFQVPSREMVMQATFTQAGSSSKGAGRGVQQRPLHPEALSVSPCASLLSSSLLKLKPMCSRLPFSPVPLLLGGLA